MGAVTLTLASGAGSGGLLVTGGQETTHILQHTSHQIQHVLQQSIRHHASTILHSTTIPAAHHHQVAAAASLDGMVDAKSGLFGAGHGRTPSVVVSSAAPSGLPLAHHTIAAQPTAAIAATAHHHPLLQFIQQTTRSTVQSPSVVNLKGKAPPQILPKPPGSAGSAITCIKQPSTQSVIGAPAVASVPTPSVVQAAPAAAATSAPAAAALQPHHGTAAFLLNQDLTVNVQMVPNGAVLVQQQTSSGLQFILKSATTAAAPKQGLVFAANGGHPATAIHPQTLILQGRTQAHQVLRLVPGQMQLQQVQTSSGPALIAVPTGAPAALPRSTPPPNSVHPPTIHLTTSPVHKKLKKKKKREEESPRLDLANLIKISGIEEEELVGGQNGETGSSVVHSSVSGASINSTKYASKSALSKHHHHHHHHHHQNIPNSQQASTNSSTTIHQTASLLCSSPQSIVTNSSSAISTHTVQQHIPAQVAQSGLRLSVGEDGMMVVHQGGDTNGVTTAHASGSLTGSVVSASVAAAAQTQLAQLIADHGGAIVRSLGGGASAARTAGVVVNQNGGVRLVDATTAVQLTEHHNRVYVSAPASVTPVATATQSTVIDQNRLQILTGVPTSTGLAVEQQNRIIVSGGSTVVTAGQASAGSRVIVQNLDQNRAGHQAVSLEQNRVIVQNIPLHQPQDQKVFVSTGGAVLGDSRIHFVDTTAGSRVIVSNEQQSRSSLIFTNGLQEQPFTNKVHIVSPSASNASILEHKPQAHIINSSPISIDSEESHENNRIQYVGSDYNRVKEEMMPHIKEEIKEENKEDERMSPVSPFPNRPNLSVLSKPPQPTPRSYDNPFMDSVQSHPSLGINKNSSPSSRIIKTKKPAVKKAALVKPMMAEDRMSDKEVEEEQLSLQQMQQSNSVRVQTIHLSPNKQQQIKQIQAQICALSNSKTRSSQEHATLQRLIAEQQKILLGGKMVPASVPSSHINSSTNTVTSSRTSIGGSPIARVVNSSECNLNQHSHQHTPCIRQSQSPVTHANKATSPIHIQVCGNSPPPVMSLPTPPSTPAPVIQQPHLTHHQVHLQQLVTSSSTGSQVQQQQLSSLHQMQQQSLHQASSPNPVQQQSSTPIQTMQQPSQLHVGHHHSSLPHVNSHSQVNHSGVLQQQPVVVHHSSSSPLQQPLLHHQSQQPSTGLHHHHHQVATATSHLPHHHSPSAGMQHHHHQQHQQPSSSNSCSNSMMDRPGVPSNSQLLSPTQSLLPSPIQQLLPSPQALATSPAPPASTVHQDHVSSQSLCSPSATLPLQPSVQASLPQTIMSASQQLPTTPAGTIVPPSSHHQPSLAAATTQTVPCVEPAPPILTPAKRATIIEEQMLLDREDALNPDTSSPFADKEDAVRRLLRYHTLDEPVLSDKDLAKADEIFEQTAAKLLERKHQMYNKFSYKILRESMRLHPTSELVMLERLLAADESATLEQMKQAATASPPSPPQPLPEAAVSTKRELDEVETNEGTKKHCGGDTDDEINAQVQSAIDSILNLQRATATAT